MLLHESLERRRVPFTTRSNACINIDTVAPLATVPLVIVPLVIVTLEIVTLVIVSLVIVYL